MAKAKASPNHNLAALLVPIRLKPGSAPPEPMWGGKPIQFYSTLCSALAVINSARERAGLTWADVSERTGISESRLIRLEAGDFANPSWRILGDCAAAVGVRLELLATDTAEEG